MSDNPSCPQLRSDLEQIKALQQEFEAALDRGRETGDLKPAQALKSQMEQKMAELKEKLWPFKELPKQELERQYWSQMSLCKERGFLETLSNGQEGIKDEDGNEYPIPSLQEIIAELKEKELFREKIATFENPYILITPFALSPKTMADKYGEQIEEHFVEERIEGNIRIPDKNKTKLFGVDGQPLELRTDKQNISLKNPVYFPKWQEWGNSVQAVGGVNKKEAIAQIGGWAISIIEGIPLAPEKGRGKSIEKDVKIKGQIK